jgi:predicted ATPase/DNA-binding SARP family transcriptional activator
MITPLAHSRRRAEVAMSDSGRHNPPPIRATLLGRVRISVGERTIGDDAWSLRSARSLLLLLLITPGHAMPKERVLDTLWPEASPDVGRNALYKALHLLRRILEPELTSARKSAYIDTRGAMIGISSDVEVWVDADACEAELRRATAAAPEARRQLLRDAVALYGGELLPSDPYEDWPIARREALQHAWEGAVLELAALDLEAGEPQASVPSLELLLAIDPTIEAAHRALMRGYVAAGQRDRALRQYERCATALERELGLGPDAETRALHAAILDTAPETELQPSLVTGPFNNLPTPPTAIVGRDREVERLRGTLWRQDVRLVTLTGPGGVGKTRLALEVASGLVADFADGVAFVPLAAVRDAGLVLQAITSTLGVSEERDVSLAATLKAYLRQRELLLVLDNFEQVLDAATEIGDLLASCASLTVLVTSRERLHLRGEHLHEVPPLAVPRPQRLPAPAMLARYGAVALFSQHMEQIDPDFRVGPDNSEVISAICRHLEGLPLAIELATAQARFFTLGNLLTRLTSRLDIEEGPRDLPARQRTLRATFAWSYDLLSPEEQAVFRHLGTAVGGYTPEAAEEIGGAPRIHAHLRSLADKHLIRWDETDDGPRITMLETIREFAIERLRESGEEPDIRCRHAVRFLGLAMDAEQRLTGTDQLAWFERLETEQGNIRSALDWALERQDEIGAMAAQGAVALWRYWLRRRSLREGIGWLDRAVARSGTDPHLRIRVLLSLARLCEAQSDYARAEALIGEALPLSRQLGDQTGVAKALNGLGEIADRRGDFQRAATLHREALAIYREHGLRRESAGSLNNLGTVAYYQGDIDGATALWEEAVAIFRELGDLWATGVLLGNLGSVAMAAGDLDRAVTLHEENLSIARLLKDPGTIGRQLCNLAEALQLRGDGDQDAILEEALELHRETNDRQSEISTLTLMANSALRRGDIAGAAHSYAESLSLCRAIGDRATMANIALLERVTALALASAQFCDAARLLGASEAVRLELGTPIMPYHEPVRDRCLAQLGEQLPAEAADAVMAEGRLMSADAALDAALAICEQAQAAPGACGGCAHDSVFTSMPYLISA